MDLKKVLFDHFEKIAVAICGLLLVLVLFASFVGENPADAQKGEVKKRNDQVKANMSEATTRVPQPQARTEQARVKRSVEGAPAGETFPSWLFHRRPLVVVGERGEQAPDARHTPALNLEGKPRLGSIALKFTEAERCQYDKHLKHRVLRAVGSPKDFVEIAALVPVEAGKTLTYVDTTCELKTKYFYQVETLAEVDEKNDVVKRLKVTLPAGEEVKRSAVAGPFERLPDTYVEVVSVVPKPSPAELAKDPTLKGTAYLKIWKWDPKTKEWLAKGYTQVPLNTNVGDEKQGQFDKIHFTTDLRLETTLRKQLEKKVGDTVVKVDADVAVFKDRKTDQTIELNNVEKAPELLEILKNPKGAFADEGSADGGSGGDDKKKPK